MGVEKPVKALYDLDDANDEERTEEVEACALRCVEDREKWVGIVAIVMVAHFCPYAVGQGGHEGEEVWKGQVKEGSVARWERRREDEVVLETMR